MSYSCSDFTEDVLNCLVTTGAIQSEAIPADSPGEQSDLAVAAIIDMSRALLACRFAAELLAGVESIGAIAE